MKRIVSILLSVILLCTLYFNTPLVSYAEDYEGEFSCKAKLEQLVDIESFTQTLEKGLINCEESIDISEYRIAPTYDNITTISDYISNYMGEFVNYDYFSYSYSSDYIDVLLMNYCDSFDTVSEFLPVYNEICDNIDYLLRGLTDNNILSEAEKALIVHDRLVAFLNYSCCDADAFSLYGALMNKEAACQGYAITYAYLMNRLGIDTMTVVSENINHAWNITFIDGVPYYVDCTWDDPIGVHEGYVGHDNFLRSQEGMIITGHHNNGKIDYKPSFSMDNTKYDNYYWQKSLTEFQLVDNKLYYVDCESYTLKSAGNDKILCSVYDDWVIDDYYYYYCPTLVSDDTDLFFSLSKYVCKYDINSGKSNIIYSPELSKDKSIYGLKNKDNVFYCTVSDAPYNASETDVVSFTYNPSDTKKCKIDVYSNDYFASFTGSGVYNENATVTIKISSDCGYDFIGYYINGVKVSSNRTYTFKATKNELIEARYDICEHNYVKTKSQSDYNDYCYSQYTCTNCGENYYQYNSESHCWGSKTVKAPTSTKVGYTQYTCAECGNYCRTSIKSPTGKTSSLKASKKTSSSQTVTWSKVSGASGYQVQISKKNSSQWSSSVTVKSNSYTFKNLTSGSNFKFRVRFYVTYNGKKYYSNWSSVLTSPTLPPSASISKLSSLKKSFKASWKKKSVSGYQIQYSTSSSFKSGVKTVNINKSSTVSKTVKGLKSKKKYYVRIRTYKTISGKKVYSAWSAKKSVTVK